MSNLRNYIIRETIIFDDENHPSVSPYDIVWPVTVLDAVIDQNTPERVTLRQILDQLFKRIDEGQEDMRLSYPVTSVRGEKHAYEPLRPEFLGDVVVTKASLDLENVDNTSDMTKPISIYQQNWVETYVGQQIAEIPPPDLSSLSAHLNDLSNPHNVTLNQINVGGRNGAVSDLIEALLELHDNSGTSHNDIRITLDRLQSIVNSNNMNINLYASDIKTSLIDHLNRGGQHHAEIFSSKEDRLNKVGFFSSPYVNAPGVTVTDLDDSHYPSTLAVANYIEARLVRPVNSSIGGNSGSGSFRDISVRADDRSLPTPSAANVGQAYLVTELKDSPGWAGLVVCRQVGNNYQWSIDKYIPVSRLDPDYFEEGPDGWKFKPQVSTVDTLTDVELEMRYVSDRLTGEKYYAFNETLHGTRFTDGRETREIFRFGELANRNTITGTDIIPSTLTGEHFQPASITADKLVPSSITSNELAMYSVGSDILANGCVRYRHLPTSNNPNGDNLSQIIENIHLVDRSISPSKLVDYSIPNEKLKMVPGQTVKGRLGLGEGKIEDISIGALALTISEFLNARSARSTMSLSSGPTYGYDLPVVSEWPSDSSLYPVGSVVYHSMENALGVRATSTTWKYVTLSGSATVPEG